MEIRVVDLFSIQHIDRETLLASARATNYGGSNLGHVSVSAVALLVAAHKDLAVQLPELFAWAHLGVTTSDVSGQERFLRAGGVGVWRSAGSSGAWLRSGPGQAA
ncbi:MAG TPA: hypothetical protein VEN79_09280 [Terriglobia bacterium]|nr:hypothetical protein [Terriglobia bacterium]